jgi:SAM-dependent methyltransferase
LTGCRQVSELAREPDASHTGSLAGHAPPQRAPRPPAPDRQSFDTLADRYDRLHDLQADPIGTWLPGVLPQPGRRALDAGCGSGRHSLVLADRFDEVIGIDLSAPMIRLATARRSRPNIAYHHADLMRFADPDGFDLVLSVNTLHHLPDLDGALDHLRRLTRPAGLVVLADCVAPPPDASPLVVCWRRRPPPADRPCPPARACPGVVGTAHRSRLARPFDPRPLPQPHRVRTPLRAGVPGRTLLAGRGPPRHALARPKT